MTTIRLNNTLFVVTASTYLPHRAFNRANITHRHKWSFISIFFVLRWGKEVGSYKPLNVVISWVMLCVMYMHVYMYYINVKNCSSWSQICCWYVFYYFFFFFCEFIITTTVFIRVCMYIYIYSYSVHVSFIVLRPVYVHIALRKHNWFRPDLRERHMLRKIIMLKVVFLSTAATAERLAVCTTIWTILGLGVGSTSNQNYWNKFFYTIVDFYIDDTPFRHLHYSYHHLINTYICMDLYEKVKSYRS